MIQLHLAILVLQVASLMGHQALTEVVVNTRTIHDLDQTTLTISPSAIAQLAQSDLETRCPNVALL